MKYLGLLCLQGIYWLLYQTWWLSYRLKFKRPYHSMKPVLSIGNLSVGGTGKTPLVDWLLTELKHRGIKVGLVTRGYGRTMEPGVLLLEGTDCAGGPDRFGDEPWSLHKAHPECLIAVHRYRDIAAQAIERQVDLLLMDDGFQHWRLHRDVDWVLMDAVAGVKQNQLLPVGRLREPGAALDRAQGVILTKCNLSDPQPLESWVRERVCENKPVLKIEYHPEGIQTIGAYQLESLEKLAGASVLAFCGIGNPEGFKKSLEAHGAKVLDLQALADHQVYDQPLVDRLLKQAADLGADLVVCTEKDGIKLESLDTEAGSLKSLSMVLRNTEPLADLLDQALERLGLFSKGI